MSNWDKEDKIKEINMVKECISVILQHKKKYLTSGIMTKETFDTKMKTIFPSLIENYCVLYRMTIESDDISLLYKMLDDIMLICHGKTDLDTVRNDLGNKLADKYLPKEKNKN